MSIQVSWDNSEHSIIRYDFPPRWTVDDFFAALHEDDVMLASVEHDVSLVFNLTESRTFPFIPISRFPELARMAAPNLGMIVVVGATSWISTLLDIFQQVYGNRLKRFKGFANVKVEPPPASC